MLNLLSAEITGALHDMQADLPRNPSLSSQIQAKILMLQSPSLKNDIINGQFWYTQVATSLNGRSIPVSAVFAQSGMRADASQAVQHIVTALPVLDGFMSIPVPYSFIDIWYGFVIGNSAGNAVIDVEDQATYVGRMTGTMVPYEAILYHELSHTYIAHEGLNQFLEVYVYNIVHTNSTDVHAWVYTRGSYTALQGSNVGVQALMDIYQMIGPDAMTRAYQALYALQPPYGQLLSDQCKQVFIDQASDALKSQVAAKVAMVGY
jgi:hypothetical protein